MPTISPTNLGYSFNTIINNSLISETSATSKAILNALDNFTVLLEVSTKNGTKAFSELNYKDNLNIAILSLFYGNILNNEKVLVQP
jgi:hypothetical protein